MGIWVETGRRIVAAVLAAFTLLFTKACGSDKPLWQRLEENQYNRYKPRLDHMVEKYGEMFEMDVYGEITCTDPEYKGWRIALGGDEDGAADNFAVRIRRDDVEAFIREFAEPFFGECKVYLTSGMTANLDVDADTEAFFTYKWGIARYHICVPYSEDYQVQGRAFIDALLARGYKINRSFVLFFEEEQYGQIDRESGSKWPTEGYRAYLDMDYYSSKERYTAEWTENYGLEHMIKKYGDIFKMDVYGKITCTDPEYQDWGISLRGNTAPPVSEDSPMPTVSDNFSIRLRRDELEAFIKEVAEPVFGECKVYITGGCPSTLDAGADIAEFFTYKPTFEEGLVYCSVYAHYSEEYKAKVDAFITVLAEGKYKMARLDVVFFDDEEKYRQAGRVTKGLGYDAYPIEGYKVHMGTFFNQLGSWGNYRTDMFWDGDED